MRMLRWLVLVLVVSSPAEAEVSSALVREGDTIPGKGDVTSISTPMANHVGGYAVTLNTLDGGSTLSHVWGNATGGPGATIVSEGSYAGYEQTAFEAFGGIDDAGDACYSATANLLPKGPNGLDGVWVGTTPVLVEEQAVPTLPGQFCTFASRPAMIADGSPVWVGGISAVQGGATQNRVLFYGFGVTPVFSGGDAVGGVAQAAQINTGGVDFNYRFSEFGTHWIMEVLLQTGSTLNDGVVVVDGVAATASGGLMREATGVTPAAGGLLGESWDNFDAFGITEAGTIFVTGDTDAVTTLDEFVLVGDQIVLREGAVLPTTAGNGTVSGAIEGAFMNEDGDWAATWDVTLPDLSNVEALIYNGEVVLLEGDSVDLDGDGVVEPGSLLVDFTGIATVVVGDRTPSGAVAVYFTADVDTEGTPSSADDTEAMFRLLFEPDNAAPVALCADRTVTAGESCSADADVDDGSFDPDGDPITLEQVPPGPYGLGATPVTLTVTDDADASDSCQATVTVIPEPLRLEVSRTALSWGPVVCDVGFDVVRGDLPTLLGSAGDFSVATDICLADDLPATSIPYFTVPDPNGGGHWILVGRVGATGGADYDSGGAGQQGSRNGEIAAAPSGCP